MEARITVSGNVGAPVEHVRAQQPGSASRSVFRLACTPRFQRQGSWIDDQTIWLRVTCWRGLAENVAESINKGDPVTVVGKLRNNVWDDDDGHHQRLELDADTVGPDLTRGVSVFRRTSRSDDDQADREEPGAGPSGDAAEAELAGV
jgi:single-strand DNA-binding protein